MKVKGFTLIELLAVIVILAIIALIATPIILNIIGDTKKSSTIRGAELYIDTVEKEIVRLNLKEKFSPEICLVEPDGNIICNEEKLVIINMKGSKPSCGEIAFEKGKVTSIKSLILDGQELETDSKGNIINKGASTICQVGKPNPQGTYLAKESDSGYFTGTFLNGTITKDKIESIKVVNHKNIPEGAANWDASEAKDGSIIAWVLDTDSNDLYELYIGGEGGVKANPDSSYLFGYYKNIEKLDLKYLDTSDVTNMTAMFWSAVKLTQLDVSNLDTSNVTNMRSMFGSCKGLTQLDVSNFNTSNVTNMTLMFVTCTNLTSLDLSNFNTSKLTTTEQMFKECSNLTKLNLTGWDTIRVTIMYYMFENCKKLTQLDLSSFDTSRVKYMDKMFYNCPSLTTIDFRNATFTSVTNYDTMFSSCNNLTTVIVKDEAARTWINARRSGVAKLPSEV